MKNTSIVLSALFACLSNLALAQVNIANPWARATVEYQPTTGAYMQLLSKEGARLIGASSSIAGSTEIHEMKIENGVMKMRRIDSLALPAGKPVALKPGGLHIMLMELKQPIREGEMMPLVLVIEDAKGIRHDMKIDVPVRSLTGPAHAAASKH